MAKLILWLGWSAVIGFVVVTAILGGISGHVRAFQLAYVVGWLGYVALCAVCLRISRPQQLGRWRFWLLGCVLLRLAVFHTAPSDDSYRYVWEGKIQLAGFNPYEHAPNASNLTSLRDDDWTKINHPDYPAIYPAFAQLEFRLAAWLWPSVYTAKAFHLVWDVVTLGLLAYALQLVGQPPHRAIVYGLSPLVLSAFAVEGHLDSLMLAFMMLAIVCATRKKFLLAGAAVGIAISSKLIAAILLPWLIVRHRRGAAVAIAVAAIAYLPFYAAGADLWSSLARFSGGDEFFSLIGTFLPNLYATTWGRLVGLLVLGIVSLRVAVRSNTISSYAYRVAGALLVLMPIVHYWYLSWVLTFLPFSFYGNCARNGAPKVNALDEKPSGLKPARKVKESMAIESTIEKKESSTKPICWLIASLIFVVYFEGERSRALASEWSMPSWAPMVFWSSFLIAWAIEAIVRRRRADSSRMGNA